MVCRLRNTENAKIKMDKENENGVEIPSRFAYTIDG